MIDLLHFHLDLHDDLHGEHDACADACCAGPIINTPQPEAQVTIEHLCNQVWSSFTLHKQEGSRSPMRLGVALDYEEPARFRWAAQGCNPTAHTVQ